jgi:16S rRNA (cytosine1402-N4)-methyltransferase
MTTRAEHVPVLPREVCRAVLPALAIGAGAVPPLLVDATCGLAGHLCLLLEGAPQARAIAFDRDEDARVLAKARLADAGLADRVTWVHAPFSELAQHLDRLGITEVAAILADLGISSLQIDRGERGFSWRADAPLDMRMDRTRGASAAEIVATIDEGTLTRILRDLGEEPDARRIAQAIVAARPSTTLALADVVANAMSAPQRRKLGLRIHPATRTFQALRLHVNDELGEIDRLLADAPDRLAVGGRLCIISFHSLEDRRVKQRFAGLSRPPAMPAGLPLRSDELPRPKFALPGEFAKGVAPSDDEVADNPRARSARLRVLERLER